MVEVLALAFLLAAILSCAMVIFAQSRHGRGFYDAVERRRSKVPWLGRFLYAIVRRELRIRFALVVVIALLGAALIAALLAG